MQADALRRTVDEYGIHDAAEEGEFDVVRDCLISDLKCVDYDCSRRCDCSFFPVVFPVPFHFLFRVRIGDAPLCTWLPEKGALTCASC